MKKVVWYKKDDKNSVTLKILKKKKLNFLTLKNSKLNDFN